MKPYLKFMIINVIAVFLFSTATCLSVSGQEKDSILLKNEDSFKKEKPSHSRFTKGTISLEETFLLTIQRDTMIMW